MSEGAVMEVRASVGDWLVVGRDRIGRVIEVLAEDGSPPYVIKWLKSGHIAMVHPDPYSRIVPDLPVLTPEDAIVEDAIVEDSSAWAADSLVPASPPAAEGT